MTRSNEFKTVDIELAAALVASGQEPQGIVPGGRLVEFIFPNNEAVKDIALGYAAGTLCLEVRRVANSRSWLYRQVKEVTRTGREVTL